MRALALAVLKVPGLDEVDTGAPPLLGERVCVIHVHVDGSATHPLGLNAGSREMDRQIVAMSERIALVMMRGTEAQLLVMSKRRRDIRDHEDRLDTDDASHTKIIGAGAYCAGCAARGGWSLCGAPWLQQVAITGKTARAGNRRNRRQPLRPVATGCR